MCCTKNNNEDSFAMKRTLFLLWQKIKWFFLNVAFMRVFDSFLFIKGIFVWSRYSTSESHWLSKNTANTKPLLHSCPHQAFSKIKSWKWESWSSSHLWLWLRFPVKHVTFSQDSQISRVIEILWSSLWLPCILLCVSVYEITALCKLNGTHPKPKQQLAF